MVSRMEHGVERVKMDAKSYFNDIYAQTQRDILRYVLVKTGDVHKIDDIFQNVYKNFYVRVCRSGYEDIEHPKAFLKRLADKELSKHYKSKAEKAENELHIEDFSIIPENENISFEELVEHKQVIDEISVYIKTLPPLTYKCFVLYYGYDRPVADFAETLGISEGNVKMRLQRARNAIRKDLGNLR